MSSLTVHTFESVNLARYAEVSADGYRVIVWRATAGLQPAISLYGPSGFLRSAPVPDHDLKAAVESAQRIVIAAIGRGAQ